MKAVSYLGAALACMTTGASLTYAVEETYRFESNSIEYNSGGMSPLLDLREINGISYELITDFASTDPFPFKSIRNLTIDFKNAPDLLIPHLKPVIDRIPTTNSYCYGQQFYASVDDVWVYRNIEIVFCTDFGPGASESPISYAIAVKGMEEYTRNTPWVGSFEITYGNGIATNTTPNKLADKVNTKFLDKDITLELLKRPADSFDPATGAGGVGFIVNASWLGHGDKKLVLPMDNGADMFSTAVTLLVDEFEVPDTSDKDIFVYVKFIDSTGQEMQTSPVDLRQLLETSYGPLN